MITTVKKLELLIFFLLVFLIPTQLAFHFWPSWAFVYGFRIDYLAPTVYLTDILLITVLVFWTLRDTKKILNLVKQHKALIVLLLFLSILNTFFSTSFLPTLYRWLKVLEFFAFAVYVSQNKKIVGDSKILKVVFFSAVTFSTIGIIQFLIGGTIGGPMYFLGERAFTVSTPGIALTNIFGMPFMRAYSTFPHPNSLAGFLGVVLVLSFWESITNGDKKERLGICVILLSFVLTFSLSAIIGIVVIALLATFREREYLFKKMIFAAIPLTVIASLLLVVFSDNFFWLTKFFGERASERINLASIAGRMISAKFWIGEGLNTFIINIPNIRGTYSYSWLLQPVHNIFLLAFSEGGIFVLLTVVFAFYKLIKNSYRNKPLVALVFVYIMVSGMFDHYWFTIQQNIFLIALLAGLTF